MKTEREMKANYTKGEWMTKELSVYNGDTGRTIAEVGRWAVAHEDEAEANAHLIAAAPELLEALTELLDLFYEHNPALYKERGFNRAIEAIKNQEKERQESGLISADKVLEILDISRTTLWQWDKKGITQPIRLGNLKRYRRSDIETIDTRKPI